MKKIKIQRDVSRQYTERNTSIGKYVEDVALRPFSGEWILIQDAASFYIGFANPFALPASYFLVERISQVQATEFLAMDESVVAKQFLQKNLHESIKYRLNILPYGKNARLVYGSSDRLPGLIIDSYDNAIFIQINTAGIDRFRTVIEEILISYFSNVKIVFIDSPSQRKKESLPHFEKSEFSSTEELVIQEGKLKLHVKPEHWQKNGYYYDHRDNRTRFYQKLTELKLNYDKGLDLFCYLGSWGITALQAGVKCFDFVDQANLESQLGVNLRLNHQEGKGVFHRSDVFAFLDQKIQMKFGYDVIISDPPSFAKSLDKKNQAIQGYKKLHKKVLQLLNPGGIVCFASCTHYVSLQEFESTILDAAQSMKRQIKLIDNGLQSLDHPFANFNDKSYYLKYLSYFVE